MKYNREEEIRYNLAHPYDYSYSEIREINGITKMLIALPIVIFGLAAVENCVRNHQSKHNNLENTVLVSPTETGPASQLKE